MELTRSVWERIAKRMPSLGNAELFRSYAGMYTETPDGYPVIDKVDGVEGLYLAGRSMVTGSRYRRRWGLRWRSW